MTSPVPPAPNFPGRQTCSSTPRLSTPTSRAVSAARRAASTARASQRACQSTSRRRASAATVVSSYSSASAAHTTARPVSSARGAESGCVSVNVTVRQAGSGHRQTRLRQRTRTRRWPNGASCSTCSLRSARTPQVRQPSTCWLVSTSSSDPKSSIAVRSPALPARRSRHAGSAGELQVHAAVDLPQSRLYARHRVQPRPTAPPFKGRPASAVSLAAPLCSSRDCLETAPCHTVAPGTARTTRSRATAPSSSAADRSSRPRWPLCCSLSRVLTVTAVNDGQQAPVPPLVDACRCAHAVSAGSRLERPSRPSLGAWSNRHRPARRAGGVRTERAVDLLAEDVSVPEVPDCLGREVDQ